MAVSSEEKKDTRGPEITEGDVILTRMDLSGKFTFASPDFLRISECSEDELIGKSMSIIRHPDVPTQLYDDLWATVRSGLPWNHVLKNRSKKGNSFWADTTIYPVLKSGKISSFMSVRQKVDRKKIYEAEKYYRKISKKKSFIGRFFSKFINTFKSAKTRGKLILVLFFLPIFLLFFELIPTLYYSISSFIFMRQKTSARSFFSETGFFLFFDGVLFLPGFFIFLSRFF